MKWNLTLVAVLALLLSACATAPPPLTPALPNAVLTPTNVPAAAPTVAPASPTATATTAPTVKPTLTPTQPAANASQACTNPFFPVRTTARWQYRISAPALTNATASFTRTISDLAATSFVEHRVVDSTSIDTTWKCDNGALTSTQVANLGNLTQNQIKLDITRNAGVTLPRPEEWEIGTTWKDTFDVTGQLRTNLVNLTGTGTAEAQNKIAAEQTTIVPAGTFRAFRVDSTITVKLNGSGNTNTTITVTIAQATWFARGVGMVKSIETIASQSITTELTSTNLTAVRAPTIAPTVAPKATPIPPKTPAAAPTIMPKTVAPATSVPGGGTTMVSLKNIAFNPNTIMVRVGTSVNWMNNETSPIPHTVTGGSPSAPTGTFDSGTLNPGQNFQFTFSTPGTFTYFCRIHGAAMSGVVVVTQ